MTRKLAGASLLAGGLIALCLAGRLLPHPPNFTPLAATALFAGAVFRYRLAALLVPLLALLISDLVIGTYDWRVMAVTYAASMLPVALSPLLAGRWPVLRVAGCSLLCAVLFFVATNFAVWAFGGWYERSLSGLIACYVAALPFFQYMLYGNLVWSGVLFGGHALARVLAGRFQGRLHGIASLSRWGYRPA
jgi:hypothetical protein